MVDKVSIRSKRMRKLQEMIDKTKLYSLAEAVELVKKTASAKFPETVEVHIRLGIDPKQSDQIVRGTVTLPHGIGKARRVAVIARGEKLKEAVAAGADVYGDDDLIEKISKGFFDFDVLVATPDVMKDIGKLGKLLGPKGLMPNPKSGTVTFDITRTVKELKAGRLEYKNDSCGIIHCPVGKVNFEPQQLQENIVALIEAVIRSKPPASKGQYLRSISIAATMGPGIKLNPAQFSK